jgi:hypothetical protein
MGLEGYVLQQHDFVITAHFIERAAEMLRRVFVIAAGIFLPSASDARWRIKEPFAFGVVARPAKKGPHCVRNLDRDRQFARGLDEIAIVRRSAHRPSSLPAG